MAAGKLMSEWQEFSVSDLSTFSSFSSISDGQHIPRDHGAANMLASCERC